MSRPNDPSTAAGAPPPGGLPAPTATEFMEAVAPWGVQRPPEEVLRWNDLARSRRRSLIALSVIAVVAGVWAGIGAQQGMSAAEVGGVLEHGTGVVMAMFTAGLLLIVMWSYDRLVDFVTPRRWPLLLAIGVALVLCAYTGIALPLMHDAATVGEVLISSAFPVAMAALTLSVSLSLSRSYSTGMRRLRSTVAAAVASDQQKGDPK